MTQYMKRQFSILMIVSFALVQACGLDEPSIGPETSSADPFKVAINGEIDQ